MLFTIIPFAFNLEIGFCLVSCNFKKEEYNDQDIFERCKMNFAKFNLFYYKQ